MTKHAACYLSLEPHVLKKNSLWLFVSLSSLHTSLCAPTCMCACTSLSPHFYVCVLGPQKPVSVVAMPEESPYASLGEVEPVNLVSFAYQIAAGMVRAKQLVNNSSSCVLPYHCAILPMYYEEGPSLGTALGRFTFSLALVQCTFDWGFWIGECLDSGWL